MSTAAVFDLDGTLVDTLADLAAATNHALTVCGFPEHGEEEYRLFVGNGAHRLIERALPEHAQEERTVDRVRALFDGYYHRHYLDRSRPYEGVQAALRALHARGVRLAVVSNKPHAFTSRMVETLFGGLFTAVFGQREGVPPKPDPAAVREALALCGAEDGVYIGDSDVDVQTGHAAGLRVIGCAWGFRGAEELRAAGADCIVNAPGEWEKLIG